MNEYWRDDMLRVIDTIKKELQKAENQNDEIGKLLCGFRSDIEYLEGVIKREVK